MLRALSQNKINYQTYRSIVRLVDGVVYFGDTTRDGRYLYTALKQAKLASSLDTIGLAYIIMYNSYREPFGKLKLVREDGKVIQAESRYAYKHLVKDDDLTPKAP